MYHTRTSPKKTNEIELKKIDKFVVRVVPRSVNQDIRLHSRDFFSVLFCNRGHNKYEPGWVKRNNNYDKWIWDLAETHSATTAQQDNKV